MEGTKKNKSKIGKTIASATEKIKGLIEYCAGGVWKDNRDTLIVRLVKTGNLTYQSFMDRGLQLKSMAITYQTILALVPALALLLAISRGFGFQELVEKELFIYFPSQSKALATALKFVDSYLKEASQGILVGVGIVVLLWTLISLLSNIEDAFNSIWDIRIGRTLIQKIKDYIAIFLLIPILMILSSGISLLMSATIDNSVTIPFLTPVVNTLLEFTPVVLCWVAFTLCFWLIPNTKVQFKYAAMSGFVCALAFEVMQLLFLNGQIYVSKYNAIYGSFAFLPLLLIWLQLSWLLLLSGCVLTYALQNVFSYNFLGDVSSISESYLREVLIVVTAIICRRFAKEMTPPTRNEISLNYGLPLRLVNNLCDKLQKAGLVYFVALGKDNYGLVPAVDTSTLYVRDVIKQVDENGMKNFIPEFQEHYTKVLDELREMNRKMYDAPGDLLVRDLEIHIMDGETYNN